MRASDIGEDSSRTLQRKFVLDDTTPQKPTINWSKIFGLLFFTYGLIVALWAMSNGIQHMKGSMVNSFIDAGGLILGFFLFYVIAFGIAWYCGFQKRDQLRRQAVQLAVARQNALQAMVSMQ